MSSPASSSRASTPAVGTPAELAHSEDEQAIHQAMAGLSVGAAAASSEQGMGKAAGPARKVKKREKGKEKEHTVGGAPSKIGGRLLTDDKDMWTHNAWDHVEWDDDMLAYAQERVEAQRAAPVPSDRIEGYNAKPSAYWDEFYKQQQDKFFIDRAWLRNEFPELSSALHAEAGPKTVVEIGCGPGNTFYPLLEANENPELRLCGFDFSAEAVSLVQSNPKFNPSICHSAVWDLSSSSLPRGILPNSVDCLLLIFVLSALHPSEWAAAVRNISSMLKPGGTVMFRDYGRFDMAQLRFKGGRLLQDNLYIRGDGTRVYFFEREELISLFGDSSSSSSSSEPADLPEGSPPTSTLPLTALSESTTTPNGPLELVELGVDRRLLLNRKRKVTMYRVWLQGRWRKSMLPSSASKEKEKDEA